MGNRFFSSSWRVVVVASIALSNSALADTPGGDAFRLKAADSFQHTIDFMVTIAIGSFAAIGLLLKDSELSSSAARWSQIVTAALGMLLGAASLYFGYASYLDLMSMTGSGAFNYSGISKSYPFEALLLLLQAPCVFLVLVITTVYKKRT
jgi:hypothetical protein